MYNNTNIMFSSNMLANGYINNHIFQFPVAPMRVHTPRMQKLDEVARGRWGGPPFFSHLKSYFLVQTAYTFLEPFSR